jgi:hypothetical protein
MAFSQDRDHDLKAPQNFGTLGRKGGVNTHHKFRKVTSPPHKEHLCTFRSLSLFIRSFAKNAREALRPQTNLPYSFGPSKIALGMTELGRVAAGRLIGSKTDVVLTDAD